MKVTKEYIISLEPIDEEDFSRRLGENRWPRKIESVNNGNRQYACTRKQLVDLKGAIEKVLNEDISG